MASWMINMLWFHDDAVKCSLSSLFAWSMEWQVNDLALLLLELLLMICRSMSWKRWYMRRTHQGDMDDSDKMNLHEMGIESKISPLYSAFIASVNWMTAMDRMTNIIASMHCEVMVVRDLSPCFIFRDRSSSAPAALFAAISRLLSRGRRNGTSWRRCRCRLCCSWPPPPVFAAAIVVCAADPPSPLFFCS